MRRSAFAEASERPGPRGSRRRVLTAVALVAILGTYLTLCLASVRTVPLYEGFDEQHHQALLEYVIDRGVMPHLPSDLFEGHQPPTYYFLASGFFRGLPRPPRPVTRTISDPPEVFFHHVGERQGCDFCGPAGTLRIERLADAAIGVVTLVLVYMLASTVLPGRPQVALASTACAAFLPQFVVMSSLLNNDALAYAEAAALLLGCAALVMAETRPRRLVAGALIGSGLGAGLVTKEYFLALALLVPIVFIIARPPRRDGLTAVAVVVGLVAAIAGWWLVHNQLTYGQPWPFDAERANIARQLPQSIVRKSLSQVLGDRNLMGDWRSFWYSGGFGQISAPQWFYTAAAVLTLPAGVGTILALLQPSRAGIGERQRRALLFLAIAIFVMFAAVVYSNLSIQQFQGRYFLTVIGSLAVLAVVGYRALLPRSIAVLAYLLPAVALLGMSLFIYFGVVVVAYRAV